MPTGAEKISQELKDFGQHSHGLCLWLAHQLLAVTAFDKSKTSELSRLSELIIKTNEEIKSETAKAIALTKELNDLDKKVEGLDKTLELKYREGKEGSFFCNEKGQLTELDKALKRGEQLEEQLNAIRRKLESLYAAYSTYLNDLHFFVQRKEGRKSVNPFSNQGQEVLTYFLRPNPPGGPTVSQCRQNLNDLIELPPLYASSLKPVHINSMFGLCSAVQDKSTAQKAALYLLQHNPKTLALAHKALTPSATTMIRDIKLTAADTLDTYLDKLLKQEDLSQETCAFIAAHYPQFIKTVRIKKQLFFVTWDQTRPIDDAEKAKYAQKSPFFKAVLEEKIIDDKVVAKEKTIADIASDNGDYLTKFLKANLGCAELIKQHVLESATVDQLINFATTDQRYAEWGWQEACCRRLGEKADNNKGLSFWLITDTKKGHKTLYAIFEHYPRVFLHLVESPPDLTRFFMLKNQLRVDRYKKVLLWLNDPNNGLTKERVTEIKETMAGILVNKTKTSQENLKAVLGLGGAARVLGKETGFRNLVAETKPGELIKEYDEKPDGPQIASKNRLIIFLLKEKINGLLNSNPPNIPALEELIKTARQRPQILTQIFVVEILEKLLNQQSCFEILWDLAIPDINDKLIQNTSSALFLFRSGRADPRLVTKIVADFSVLSAQVELTTEDFQRLVAGGLINILFADDGSLKKEYESFFRNRPIFIAELLKQPNAAQYYSYFKKAGLITLLFNEHVLKANPQLNVRQLVGAFSDDEILSDEQFNHLKEAGRLHELFAEEKTGGNHQRVIIRSPDFILKTLRTDNGVEIFKKKENFQYARVILNNEEKLDGPDILRLLDTGDRNIVTLIGKNKALLAKFLLSDWQDKHAVLLKNYLESFMDDLLLKFVEFSEIDLDGKILLKIIKSNATNSYFYNLYASNDEFYDKIFNKLPLKVDERITLLNNLKNKVKGVKSSVNNSKSSAPPLDSSAPTATEQKGTPPAPVSRKTVADTKNAQANISVDMLAEAKRQLQTGPQPQTKEKPAKSSTPVADADNSKSNAKANNVPPPPPLNLSAPTATEQESTPPAPVSRKTVADTKNTQTNISVDMLAEAKRRLQKCPQPQTKEKSAKATDAKSSQSSGSGDLMAELEQKIKEQNKNKSLQTPAPANINTPVVANSNTFFASSNTAVQLQTPAPQSVGSSNAISDSSKDTSITGLIKQCALTANPTLLQTTAAKVRASMNANRDNEENEEDDDNWIDDALYGETPLYAAAKNGRKIAVKSLLDKKADPKVACTDRKTPLHVAVESNHTEVVKLLLEAKADPKAVDGHGRTSLDIAAQKGRTELTKLLSEAEEAKPLTSNTATQTSASTAGASPPYKHATTSRLVKK